MAGQTIDDNVYLDEVRARLGAELGEVVAVCPMSHTGFGTRKGLSVATRGFGIAPSLLAYTTSKMASKQRAGGLPDQFLLIVTADDRVHAYGYKGYPGRGGGKFRIDEECAAVWDRGALQVSAQRKGMMLHVTIESPAEDEKITCSVGNSPFADAFLEILRRPVAA